MVARPYFLNNLIPRRETKEAAPDAKPLRQALAEIHWIQYLQFFSGWLCWTCDALDFFCVSLSITNLVAQFPGKDANDIVRCPPAIFSNGVSLTPLLDDCDHIDTPLTNTRGHHLRYSL